MTASASITRFDCDARTRALTQPELIVGGYRFHGQLLGIVEWFPFLERLDELNERRAAHGTAIAANAALDAQQDARPRVAVPPAPAGAEWLALFRDFLRTVFPRRTRLWWMPDPVKLLERAPDPSALSAAFWDFFALQSRVMMDAPALEATPSEQTATDGTLSLDATTRAPSAANASAASG